ncbi:transposase, partial [Caldovatus aquaticus]
MRPGASVAGVADRHGMSRSLLFAWRRQAREGAMPGLERTELKVPPTLVPVRVVEDQAPWRAPGRCTARRGPCGASRRRRHARPDCAPARASRCRGRWGRASAVR